MVMPQYFTAIMHCRSWNTHTLFWVTMQHFFTESCTWRPSGTLWTMATVTWTHTHTYHISNSLWPHKLTNHTLSPPMLCVLVGRLSVVTDMMTGGHYYESCLGWWPQQHTWVPCLPANPGTEEWDRVRCASLIWRVWDSGAIIRDRRTMLNETVWNRLTATHEVRLEGEACIVTDQRQKKDSKKFVWGGEFGLKPQSFSVLIVGLKDCSINLVRKPQW